MSLRIWKKPKAKSKLKEIIEETIESKMHIFECPVCFETISCPLTILSCTNDHYICSECCKGAGIKACPICRECFEKNLPKRRIQSEKILSYLLKQFDN